MLTIDWVSREIAYQTPDKFRRDVLIEVMQHPTIQHVLVYPQSFTAYHAVCKIDRVKFWDAWAAYWHVDTDDMYEWWATDTMHDYQTQALTAKLLDNLDREIVSRFWTRDNQEGDLPRIAQGVLGRITPRKATKEDAKQHILAEKLACRIWGFHAAKYHEQMYAITKERVYPEFWPKLEAYANIYED